MLKERDLSSSTDVLDALWRALDKVRSTSRTVTVDKTALAAILLDHSKMAQELFSTPYRRPRDVQS